MAYYTNGTDTIYCPFERVAEILIESGWVLTDGPEVVTEYNLSVTDLATKTISPRNYVESITYGINSADKSKITADNIRNGISFLGVTGLMQPYVAPAGEVELTYTENGTYIVDCSGKATAKIIINVPTTSGAETEDDEDIMTIIPCKVVIDHTYAITALKFKSDAAATANAVKSSDKPYAIKLKMDIYNDLSVVGMGVIFVQTVYANLTSYNSSTYSADNLDFIRFDAATPNGLNSYNPITVQLNISGDEAGSAIYNHITADGISSQEFNATFDLEE